jgi:hypothetical protein
MVKLKSRVYTLIIGAELLLKLGKEPSSTLISSINYMTLFFTGILRKIGIIT